MSVDTAIVTDRNSDAASSLQRFLAGLTLAAVAFAALMLLAGLAFSDIATRLAGLVSGAFALWLAIPWWLLRRGQFHVAAMAICAGLILVAPPGAAALPYMIGTVGIVPLIAVVFGLQFLNRREMAVVIICAGLSTLAAGILAELSRVSTNTPARFEELLRVASLTMAVVLVSYLIWQVSLRFREAVDRTAAVNQDLEVAQADVGHANRELSLRVGDLEDRNREMALLSEMSQLLQGCRTADEVNSVIQVSGRSLFPDDHGQVLLLTPSRQALELVAQWGLGPSGSSLTPDACWALRRKAIHSYEAGSGEVRCPHVSADARWALCVPLAGDGEIFGVITLEAGRGGDRAGAPRWNRRLLAATVAEHLGLFISNFRLRETLTVQSTRDPLTGLFNRRFMEESLERETRRAAREGKPLSVLMLDLDHFKPFNDAYGHGAGDELLRALGGFLRTHTRADDVACRYGGDEFTVILPNASVENATRRAEALRLGARNAQVLGRDRAAGSSATQEPVTISVGIAAYPEHGSTAEELLRAADAALFAAKRSGRDQIAMAPVEA
jgi:diguanylate cyclase (GGDEF)-like protein